MDDDQQFCLRWNNHQSTLISVFDTLLENGTLVDCTLAAEGKFLKAHKVVLCACSPYFASLLSQQYDKHPIFILKDVKFQELRAMMDYMYRGEVNISQDQLAALLKAAESLQIKGLSDNRSAAKGVDNAQQKQSQVPVSGVAAGSAAKTGLTIEQNKRLRVAADAELSGSREGSTSPSSRKRKKVRRRSVDTNNAAAIDNHDQMSNSSSQSATQPQAQPITSTPLTLSQITTATSAANVLNVTKKTDNNSNDDDDEDEQTIVRHKTRNTDGSNKDKIDSELLIEPKSEFEDGNDEPVEDLTMGDEDLMEDLEQAGPSHGGEGSSQGYQWQVDRSQDEVYLATQESSGQHRDAQENLTCTPMVYLDDDKNGIGTSGERFFCMVCGKNYLRKRHLQRHMRDECIGIPPRFECEFCPSKFRRKYHLVRHLNSRHGDMVTKENTGIKVNSRIKIDQNAQQMCDSEDQEIASTSSTLTNENLVMSAAAMAAAAEMAANFNKDFSVDAIMMKRESNDAYPMPDMKLLEELQKKIGLVANQDLFSTLRQMNPIKF